VVSRPLARVKEGNMRMLADIFISFLIIDLAFFVTVGIRRRHLEKQEQREYLRAVAQRFGQHVADGERLERGRL